MQRKRGSTTDNRSGEKAKEKGSKRERYGVRERMRNVSQMLNNVLDSQE